MVSFSNTGVLVPTITPNNSESGGIVGLGYNGNQGDLGL